MFNLMSNFSGAHHFRLPSFIISSSRDYLLLVEALRVDAFVEPVDSG